MKTTNFLLAGILIVLSLSFIRDAMVPYWEELERERYQEAEAAGRVAAQKAADEAASDATIDWQIETTEDYIKKNCSTETIQCTKARAALADLKLQK